MMNAKAYKNFVEDLVADTLNLLMAIHTQFPREVRPGSKFAHAGGSQWNNDAVRIVASRLEDVTYRFDQVQHALGLDHPEDARFGHLPAGSTSLPPDEDQAMDKKKSAPKATRPQGTPVPSKKPKIIDGPANVPSKQKARNPRGGSGYSSSGRHG